MKLLENYKKSLKSSETEDWLDYRVIRPLSYLWAVLFAKLDIHPNTVTIASMFIGVASAYFFMQGSFYYGGTDGLVLNIIGILLLMWADIFDCTDGQLARLTGKKSQIGRILDGIAGFVWFVPIYVCMVYRFYLHHEIEFSWLGIEDTPENALIATSVVFCFALYSGFAGMGAQQRIADYYIQAHLFFLKGAKGSELDNSERQKEILATTDWSGNLAGKMFQKSYVTYTQKQERKTPQFQRLMAVLKDKFGKAENMPEDIRKELHAESKKLVGLNACLTFNFREFWLFLFCLLDVPVLNFLWEAIVMELIAVYVIRRHEGFCRRVADRLKG